MAGRTVAAVILALQTGTFALFGGKPQVVSQVQLVGHNELAIVQRSAASHATITKYVPTEGQDVHVVLVRDDFRSFSHVHPAAAGHGVYRTQVALDAGHRFYAYVASQPQGFSPQVFRFVLQAGAPPHHLDTSLAAPHTTSLAGHYAVHLDRDVLSRNGGMLQVQIAHRAALHGVLVNTSTLTYAHVDGALVTSGPCCTYRMQMPHLARGVYRMWLQFNDGADSLTAPFTIDVR
jgi:hypothetical protein